LFKVKGITNDNFHSSFDKIVLDCQGMFNCQKNSDNSWKEDYYKRMRNRISKWLNDRENKGYKYAEYLLAAPDLFHLLCKLAADKRISRSSKLLLTIGIVYFVSPIDIIPEGLIGPVGFSDDIALAAYILNKIINKSNIEIVKQHWAGDEDVLLLIQNLIREANKIVGEKRWNKLLRNLNLKDKD
jgi:uncharacterized membrane protein YkvA (DUF1232 family)